MIYSRSQRRQQAKLKTIAQPARTSHWRRCQSRSFCSLSKAANWLESIRRGSILQKQTSRTMQRKTNCLNLSTGTASKQAYSGDFNVSFTYTTPFSFYSAQQPADLHWHPQSPLPLHLPHCLANLLSRSSS